MSMRGIDVSSWQSGLSFKDVSVDFGIVKATEGTNYVNPYCDSWIQELITLKKPFGVYHFAKGNDAKKEAEYFYNNCTGYIGRGIFALDYEIYTSNDVKWCEAFIQKFYDLTKIWPLLYISASRTSQFANSWTPEKCGLWLAGYPIAYAGWTDDNMPYDPSPWKFAAIWQFTSSLIIKGWFSKLDGNIAYMDADVWNKYAGKSSSSSANSNKVQPVLSYKQLAIEIIRGEWGNGTIRKNKIVNAGYDYDTTMSIVNDYYAKANECIRGIWGNGWNRKNALESAGYDYDTVQYLVNVLMK